MEVYEIVKHIHQIAYDAKDHQYGGRETGVLSREDGHKVTDSRVIDGFYVNTQANMLTISYHTDCNMAKAHEDNFDNEIEEIIDKLASFLKKEFKKDTGKALTLTPQEDSYQGLMQAVNYDRVWVKARKNYTIGQIKYTEDDPEVDDRDSVYKKIDSMLEEKYDPLLKWKKYLKG